MKQIVIAVDGSPAACEAVELGLALATVHEAKVTFVRVFAESDLLVAGVSASAVVVVESAKAHTRDHVLEKAAALAAARGVEAAVEARTGFPEEEIVKAAERIDADLIVVGSRGLGPVGRTLLGSVSQGVLEASKRPVLVVRATHVSVGAAV